MLSIVEALKWFGTILIGQILRIYTNYENLTCKFSDTDRLLRWRLILEYYGLDIEYIQGGKGIVTNALSKFPISGNQES